VHVAQLQKWTPPRTSDCWASRNVFRK